MESQALDDMLSSASGIADVPRDYTSIDVYTSGAARMYCHWNPFCNCPNGRQLSSDPMVNKDSEFGLMNQQPFQYGFDLGSGLKIDFHGPDPTTLTYGHVKPQFGNDIIKEYNGYECSMLDPILKNSFKKFP